MLIDTHCHLSSYISSNCLRQVLERAEAQGVWRMIAVGTSSEDWALYRRLSQEYRGRIFYSVGLHPCHVDENWETELQLLGDSLASSEGNRPVALGEIGLDFFRIPTGGVERDDAIQRQKSAFARQLKMASSFGLPVIVHSRSAFDECVRLIDQNGYPWNSVVFHCFSEGPEAIQRINLRGGRGSFTGNVTYATNRLIKEALREQGIDRLMIETDAPYLTPMPHKGKANEPAWLPLIAAYAARILHANTDLFKKKVWENSCEFFSIN